MSLACRSISFCGGMHHGGLELTAAGRSGPRIGSSASVVATFSDRADLTPRRGYAAASARRSFRPLVAAAAAETRCRLECTAAIAVHVAGGGQRVEPTRVQHLMPPAYILSEYRGTGRSGGWSDEYCRKWVLSAANLSSPACVMITPRQTTAQQHRMTTAPASVPRRSAECRGHPADTCRESESAKLSPLKPPVEGRYKSSAIVSAQVVCSLSRSASVSYLRPPEVTDVFAHW